MSFMAPVVLAEAAKGLVESEAVRLVQDAGYGVRVEERDDVWVEGTPNDWNPRRISLSLRGGHVFSSRVG